MIRSAAMLALALALGGCVGAVVPDRAPIVIDDAYSRAEVDAINAETQCRALARNLVQTARCGVRR